MSNTTLSKLQKGDRFTFEKTVVRYVTGRCAHFVELEVHDYIFEVVECFKKSIKCRMEYGKIEWLFKFDGYFNNYVPVEDYKVFLYPKQ